MKPKMSGKCALALGLTLAFSVPFTLHAQSTSAASDGSAANPTEDEVVILNPFVVDSSSDIGYTAIDALAGGRTRTPVKYTPAAMSSLTRTFIEDLGIQNVRDALQWTPNVVPTDPLAGKGFGGQAFHAWSFNYRGAGAGQQGGPGPTKNYFSFYQDADAYNIDRIEFTRGPNSILFGLGTVGGTLTTYTKVPRLDRTSFSAGITADNHGSLRLEADYNVVASDKLAIRINALRDRNEGWRNGDETDRDAVDFAVLYRLTENTSIRAEYERAKVKKTLISTTIADKMSGWDGTTASDTWMAAPTGSARTQRSQELAWGTPTFFVYIPGLGGNALMDWNGGYASTSTMADAGNALPFAAHSGWYPAEVKLPWEATFTSTANIPVRPSKEWTYGHGISETEFDNLTVFFDHRLNENFDLQLAFYRYDDDHSARNYEGGSAAIDINRQLPNGAANPNFGEAYVDFFLSRQTQSRAVTEARAQINYNFDGELFGSKWTQLFSLSTARKKIEISARQYLAQIANGPAIPGPRDWPWNMVWGRLYLDEPNQRLDLPEAVGGYAIDYLPKPDGYWFDFDDEFELTDYAFMSHSRLLDDRLSVLAGVRHDRYDEHLVSLRRNDSVQPPLDQISDESDKSTTYSAGAVYYFNWLGVFGNYSKNMLPPNAGSQPYLTGDRPAPENGKGFDFGFRVSTGDNKYYASISRYETESEGRNVENPVDIRGVWQAYNRAQGLHQDTGLGGLAYSDTTSMKASGYEFEITANPLRNFRLQATYGLPDTEIVDFYPGARSHIAENLSTWNTQADNTADATLAGDLRNKIGEAQNTITQARVGAPQQGSVDYTASFFALYSFTDSALKGFSVGGGAAFTGKPYLGTYGGEEYFGNSIRTVNALVAYETKIGETKVRFGLNIDNVLDADDPILTNYHWGYADAAGVPVKEGYYFQAPRTFRLSARFTF